MTLPLMNERCFIVALRMKVIPVKPIVILTSNLTMRFCHNHIRSKNTQTKSIKNNELNHTKEMFLVGN